MTNGTITVRNSYNPDGARIAKIVNRSNGSETHRYTYNGGKLVYDIIRFNNNGNIYNHTILMSYDESGRPFMITYNNISYYYLLNLQGDVVGIMNVSGDLQVAYTYDAWGNVLSITGPMADTMGQYNQLRYRGYVYDPETGLYYVSSRYYDPEIGRWINADSVIADVGDSIQGYNMLTYCDNSPVNLSISNSSFENNSIPSRKTTHFSFYVQNSVTLDIYVRYNVPLYNQNGYSLCWAFCQVMVEDYLAGLQRTNAQATARAIEISISVNGSNWNQGGWPTNASDVFSEIGKEPPSLANLYYSLVQNGPIYAYYSDANNAHLIVVTGVSLSKGIIYTNNPWGIHGEQSYEEFLDGFAGMPADWDMSFGFLIYPD